MIFLLWLSIIRTDYLVPSSFLRSTLIFKTDCHQSVPDALFSPRSSKDNEERRKRQKKEAKRLAKKKQQEEQEELEFEDPEMAAMMGFGGFGGGSKKK